MPTVQSSADPFGVDGFFEIPELDFQPSKTWRPVNIDLAYEIGAFKLAEPKFEALPAFKPSFFRLSPEDIELPDLSSSTNASTTPSDDEENDLDKNQEKATQSLGDLGDIWRLPEVVVNLSAPNLISWDDFLHDEPVEPLSAYLGESGPAVFDTIITQTQEKSPRIANPDRLLPSLFELGLGRNSRFFHYDESTGAFTKIVEEFTTTGISVELANNVMAEFMEMGACTRKLFASIEEASNKPLSCRRSITALSAAISTILYALHERLDRKASNVQSLLQLVEIFEKPNDIVRCLNELFDAAESETDHESVTAAIIVSGQRLAQEGSLPLYLLQEVVARVADPLAQEIKESIGIMGTQNTVASEVRSKSITSRTGTLFSPEMSNLIVESCHGLDLLQESCPEHILLRPWSTVSNPPDSGLKFSWDALESLQQQAREYEENLKTAILQCRDLTSFEKKSTRKADEELPIWNSFIPLHGRLLLPPISRNHLDSQSELLYNLTAQALSKEPDLTPSLALPIDKSLTVTLAPIVGAQHRLLSYSLLQLLFDPEACLSPLKSSDSPTANLLSHVNLQHRLHLLCDGRFASRISHALFSNGLGPSNSARSFQSNFAGLNLQSRSVATWPPASSELRLALSGILTETLISPSSSSSPPTKALLSSISFAIRNDLSSTALDACLDPHSIHALDFLRLQYKPNPPNPLLDAVISKKSLERYDSIFRYMLQLLRIKSMAQSLTRDASNRALTTRNNHLVEDERAQKSSLHFRVEIQHVVGALADYAVNHAIAGPWMRFIHLIEQLAQRVHEGDVLGALALAPSGIEGLRKAHEDTLDEIAAALWLRGGVKERQQQQQQEQQQWSKLKDAVDEIMRLVLRAAPTAAAAAAESSANSAKAIETERKKFATAVSRLVRYLQADCLPRGGSRSLSSTCSQEAGVSSFAETRAAREYLLLKLDMFGYYSAAASSGSR